MEAHPMSAERPPLEEMTLRQLRRVASEYNVSRYSRMRKDQLLEAIKAAQRQRAAKSSQPSEAQAEVVAAKFDVGQASQPTHTVVALAAVDEGLPELPAGYGDSRIMLMPRDPQWAYAYWDIPNSHKEEVRRQGGIRLALRFYDVTDINLDYQRPHSLQQYECDELAREWYLPVPVSDRDYMIEIGYITADGRWLLLARSTAIRVPPVYPSDWVDDQFVTIDWDEALQAKTVLRLGQPARQFAEVTAPVYEKVFALAQAAESQRVAASVVTEETPPESLSSYVFPSGVGKWAEKTESGAGMSGAGMSGAGMSGAGMSGVGMSGVGMSGAGMSGVGMSGVGMSGAGMSGVGMSGVGMPTASGMGLAARTESGGMSGVGMSGVGMAGAGMSGVGMSGVGMYTASGSGAGLLSTGLGARTESGVGMSGVGMMAGTGMSGIGMMSGAGLAGAGLAGTNMSGVGMSGVGMYSTSGTGLYSASGIGMSGVGMAGMPGMGMAGANMSGIGMSGVGMSGVGMSSAGFSASMPPSRPRQFWLVADAELIVYGATEPDATVTIGGRPVQLNPDGTFRFQISFQDGQIDYPIMAVAVDGEQMRSVHMKFIRETPERRTNTEEEAVSEWLP
jgi:uncharacterized protein